MIPAMRSVEMLFGRLEWKERQCKCRRNLDVPYRPGRARMLLVELHQLFPLYARCVMIGCPFQLLLFHCSWQWSIGRTQIYSECDYI